MLVPGLRLMSSPFGCALRFTHMVLSALAGVPGTNSFGQGLGKDSGFLQSNTPLVTAKKVFTRTKENKVIFYLD